MATVRNRKQVKKTIQKNTTRTRSVRAETAARATRGTTARKSTNGKNAAAHSAKPILNQKELLLKDRVQVENELALLRAEMQEAPETTGDEVDLNVYEREKTLGLLATYERRLEEINAALVAAERGKYGICERCGNAIDPERLKIFPEARLCVTCKNEVERETRRLRM